MKRETKVLDLLLRQIDKTKVFQYGIVKTWDIEFLQEVREMCKNDLCRHYGKTWACPPAVGTVDECRERCLKYEKMLVFTGKFMLEDSYDIEGMLQGMKDFKQIARQVESAIKPYLNEYQILSNEGCDLCKICTYPHAPCRFPEKLHHSIEGYGIIVSELAKKANVNYINGQNSITYFGALLFNEKDIFKKSIL